MADITVNPIFARNQMPNLSISNAPSKPPTNVSGNPYANLNVTQDPNKVTNAANTLAGTLDSPIQGLKDLSTMKVDTSGSPSTSLQPAIDRISNIAASGVTQGTLDKFSSLRPENKYEGQIDTALSRLGDYSAGTSKVDQTIANRYLTKFDASSAASNMAQGMRIASNPYLTEGAKQAATAELNRTAASQRSELVGGLAEKAQERAFAATKDYANMTLEAANFKENQYKTDLAAATQEVTNNLNAAISAGNLDAQEISNNISIWNTEVNARIQDMNRSLDALVKSGQLTVDKARIQMDGILDSSRIEGQNITNGLLKAKGIAEYAGQEANIKQIDAAIATSQNEIYKSNNSLATESILSYREKWQGTDKDNADEAINDPVIRQKLENTWKSIPGNEGIPMSEDWAKAYYKGISTAAEISTQTTTNKLKELEKIWVGEGPGKMSKEAFDNFANNIRLINDFGGMLKMSSDGKSIYMVDASGKPMTDINNKPYAWNVSDGSRATVTDTTSTKESFDKFMDTLSEGDIPSGVSDSTVRDAYEKLISEGKTPTRSNIREALKNAPVNTSISSEEYTKIQEDAQDMGADPDRLVYGFDDDLSKGKLAVSPEKIRQVYLSEISSGNYNYYDPGLTKNATFQDSIGKIGLSDAGRPVMLISWDNANVRFLDLETGKIVTQSGLKDLDKTPSTLNTQKSNTANSTTETPTANTAETTKDTIPMTNLTTQEEDPMTKYWREYAESKKWKF